MTDAENNQGKICFVVGPIGDEESPTRISADWLLNGIIIPTFREHFSDFTVVRADTLPMPGMIDSQVINLLLDADLVIADMSERNPNAFYEMGIRHLASKPIVHMYADGTAIPFDVAPHRAIKFSTARFERLEQAKVQLRTAVAEAVKPGFKVDNPVTRARGIQALEAQAPPELHTLFSELSSLRREIAEIRNEERLEEVRKLDFIPTFSRVGTGGSGARVKVRRPPRPLTETLVVKVAAGVRPWHFSQEIQARYGSWIPEVSVTDSTVEFTVFSEHAATMLDMLQTDEAVESVRME